MHRKANIVTTVKVRRLEWAGRLVRMCEGETLNKVFMGKPEGRRRAERPKLRWVDCIEKWSQSMGVRRWRKKAEDISVWAVILKEALVILLGTVCQERRRCRLFRH
jgi:hypothetical protein